MESWSYASEGKGLLFSDEVDLSVDIFSRSRKPLIGWEAESEEGIGVVDLGFTEMPIKPSDDDRTGLEMFRCNEVGSGPSKVVVTSPTCIITSHSSPDCRSVDSNSLTESNSSDSSLIDLKLGRLVDCTGARNGKFSRERSVLSSLSPTSSKKKARAISPRAQTPCCVVYGCNKDLSSSKDYHKRHKVCDVHSKTPKVIVNGMEQRFCQQCSRFHLLSEFDDGKRSCRKRLAGHNERRRKPQFGGLTILDSAGTKLLETSLAKRMSLLLPFPGDTLYPERYEEANWLTHVKSEEKSIYGPPVATTARGQLVLKSLLHSLNASRTPPLSTEHNGLLDVGSSIHGLAGLSSHSGCALSLLSVESQDISHFAGSNMVAPLISQAGCAQHSMDISNKLSKVSDTNHTGLHFEAADGLLHESGFLSAEYYNSPKHGSTVDLLQLSSHLRRVEQERNSILLKHENENENEDVFGYHSNYGV